MDLLEEIVVNEEFLKRTDVYNCSRGGKNPCMFGKNNPFFGKTHTPEVRARISAKNKNKTVSLDICNKISAGVKRSLAEHPELLELRKTTLGKKKYINVETGEAKFFKPGEQPSQFEIKNTSIHHVSKEQKAENNLKISERNKASHWYNNGICEIFCLPNQVLSGYVKGRLPTINVGRKLSDITKDKIRKKHIGIKPANKGKVWITNGFKNKYVAKSVALDVGWHYGMTRRKAIDYEVT